MDALVLNLQPRRWETMSSSFCCPGYVVRLQGPHSASSWGSLSSFCRGWGARGILEPAGT